MQVWAFYIIIHTKIANWIKLVNHYSIIKKYQWRYDEGGTSSL